MLQQGFGADTVFYLLFLVGLLGVSAVTHVGMGKLPLPGDLLVNLDKGNDELEVEWEFAPKEPTPVVKPPKPEPEPEPPEPKYVETNPEAPENEPDETPNESDRSQQSAQEELDPKLLTKDAPKTEGDVEESQKIKKGSLTPKQPPPPQGIFSLKPPSPQKPSDEKPDEGKDENKAEAPPPPTTSPLTIEEGKGEGVATIEQKEFQFIPPTETKVIPLQLPKNPVTQATAKKEQTARPAATQPRKPLPRPKLPASVLPGMVRTNNFNAQRQGTLAIDAKWSEFGEYSNRMVAAITLQWHKLIYNANLQSLPVSVVHVRFVLNKEGAIESIEVLENTAGQLPAFFCTDAIESRAPFGPWTKPMITTFGDKTDVNIHFHYR